MQLREYILYSLSLFISSNICPFLSLSLSFSRTQRFSPKLSRSKREKCSKCSSLNGLYSVLAQFTWFDVFTWGLKAWLSNRQTWRAVAVLASIDTLRFFRRKADSTKWVRITEISYETSRTIFVLSARSFARVIRFLIRLRTSMTRRVPHFRACKHYNFPKFARRICLQSHQPGRPHVCGRQGSRHRGLRYTEESACKITSKRNICLVFSVDSERLYRIKCATSMGAYKWYNSSF